MSTNTQTKTDIPEVPLEIQNREAKPVDERSASILGITTPKKKINAGLAAYQAQQRAIKAGKVPGKGKSAKEAYRPKAEPRAGLTRQQIEEICGRSYPGMPKSNPELGDLDPKFRAWLWDNHPQDAEVRYYLR